MRPISASIILGAALAATLAAPAWSYDRSAAYNYATTWCNTNFDNRPDGRNPNGNADHVNNSSGAIHGGPGNYTWWYNTRIPVTAFGYYLFDWLTQRSDNGTGKFP